MPQGNRITRGKALIGEIWSPDQAKIVKTITTAQVLALNATPIEVVPAPGAGKANIFIGALVALDYNSAAYAGVAAGEDLCFKYTNGAGAKCSTDLETVGFLDQTADQVRWVPPLAYDAVTLNVLALTPVVNAAIVLHLLVGEVTTGNSPLKITTFYRQVRTYL